MDIASMRPKIPSVVDDSQGSFFFLPPIEVQDTAVTAWHIFRHFWQPML